MIASTVARVPDNTADEVNYRIRLVTEQSVASCASRGPEAIEHRLAELDQEWDVERMLEANASLISLVGIALGATVDRKWFWLPAAVSGFLLQHAVQGWCPPLPVLRRLGVRTASEIDYERYALKGIRGDFRDAASSERHSANSAKHALEVARS